MARALGERLWGVRLDTSETMVDRSLWHEMGSFRPTGVDPELVCEVRRGARRARASSAVKIVVSGGFDAARIAAFEAAGVPVDAYGVGSSLLRGVATSPPTSCSWRASPAPRWAGRIVPTRGWSAWSSRPALVALVRGRRLRALEKVDEALRAPPDGRLGIDFAAAAHSARASSMRSVEK